MKKTVFFIGAFLSLLSLQAQFTVEDDAGVPIEDGDVITVGQIAPAAEAKLPFYINNTSSGDINVRIEFVSAVNADGSQMQLCIMPPKCYNSITIGESYPQDPNVMKIFIPSGTQSGYGNYFNNLDPGNGTNVIDYVFRFYQVNSSGFEIGTSLTMTYRYDPLLGTQEINKLDIAVYPTLVEEVVTVETPQPLDMEIYDLNGALVKNEKVNKGKNQLNLAGLSSQLYLVQFENEQGETQTIKLIKR